MYFGYSVLDIIPANPKQMQWLLFHEQATQIWKLKVQMGSKKNQDFLDGWTLNWNPLSVTMHKILLRGTYQKKTRRTRAVYDVVWKRQKKESLSKFHSVGRYYLILKSFVVAILSLSRPKIKKQINLYGHLQHEIHEPSANQQSFELRTLTSSQPTPACSRGFLLHPCSSLSFPGVN